MKKSLEAKKWEVILRYLSNEFSPGEEISLSGIVFLIGLQELGKGAKKFRKDDKVNIIHIAFCCLLAPFGFYKFEGFDKEGWPHYTLKEQLPALSSGEQNILIKKSIIKYFEKENLLDFSIFREEMK